MTDKESRDKDGTPGFLRGHNNFEVKHAAHVRENQWELHKQHCLRAVSGLVASTVEVVGKERQQHGHSAFVTQGVCRAALASYPSYLL